MTKLAEITLDFDRESIYYYHMVSVIHHLPFFHRMPTMIRFRLAERIADKERLLGRRLPLAEIAEATGISTQTLSNLRSPRAVVTNTAYVEALCRFFGCGIVELVEFDPPIGAIDLQHVDGLYPDRRGGRGAT